MWRTSWMNAHCATEALLDPESTTGIIDKATMIERIKRVINKFEEIAEQRSKFNLFNLTSTTGVVHCRVDPRRETSSFPTEFKVIGRDEEIKDIVNLLVNNINAEGLSIYAIVGIGGLGKTTLAQKVYNDNMVKDRFELKRWVCVSENFDVKSLIGDIIQSGSNNSSQPLDQLQRSLQEELSGKRFLLVLDDVWNEDPTKWSILKSSLTCGAKGSSIVVTTRSNRVASLMGFSHKCHPKMLSEEDCFSLFKHHAFDEGEGEHYPNLESIGKEIVKKCGGVPLAAKALGGLLRFQREENEWLFVKDSKLWDLPQDKEDSILPALLLSYNNLPPHLRQCFAYCSIFPKDYSMNKEVLIQLWMANGFPQPKGNMELEDIGNGIFNDLLWRGFIQEVSIDFFYNTIESYKMHDLVHDLACSITRDECFSVVTDADIELVVGRRNTTRHLAICHTILFSPNFSLSMFQSFLRTLLQLDAYMYSPDVPPLNFSNLIYLRVLDLSGSDHLETLPESIARLKLLRYLDLSGTGIALLSDEVFGNLINLETLKLCECPNLEMLPGNMRKLTNLRHLDIARSTWMLPGMPVGMGQLKCLHMLSEFVVSEESGCGVGELQELDHLGGTLSITCLWKQRDPRDAENAKLSKKKNIRSLWLNWYKTNLLKYLWDDWAAENAKSERSLGCGRKQNINELYAKFERYTAPVPEYQTNSMHEKLIADALQPHPNIEELEFDGYGGSDFPRWMNYSTCLSSLVTLKLTDCSKCKRLPTLGLLPHLKKLFLTRIHVVECIGNEFYCDEEEGMILFPALEQLQLDEMRSLEEWKEWSSSSPLPSSSRMKEGEVQVSVFPVLERLKISSCPNLRTFPSLPLSIQHLDLRDCHEKIFEQSLERLPHLSHLSRLSISSFPSRYSRDQGMVITKSLQCGLCSSMSGDFHNLPEGMQSLTSLTELEIRGCYGLKSLNNCLRLLTNLHELTIFNCRELELLHDDFQNLVSLQSLHLGDLPNLPEGMQNLNALQKLEITYFPMLASLPDDFQNLVSLQSLHLKALPKLEAVPEGMQNLTSLRNLKIEFCDGLKSLNNCLQLLTNLHSLRIGNCRELEFLPDDFQNLVSLQSLDLQALPKLEAVPVVVGSSTLESVSFHTCPGLKNLPEWITNQRSLLQTLVLVDCKNLKSLPEGFQHLTALRHLKIVDSHPELHRRCQENTGEDWHKIAHIPGIYINTWRNKEYLEAAATATSLFDLVT